LGPVEFAPIVQRGGYFGWLELVVCLSPLAFPVDDAPGHSRCLSASASAS
jgi:hypothetical protein